MRGQRHRVEMVETIGRWVEDKVSRVKSEKGGEYSLPL